MSWFVWFLNGRFVNFLRSRSPDSRDFCLSLLVPAFPREPPQTPWGSSHRVPQPHGQWSAWSRLAGSGTWIHQFHQFHPSAKLTGTVQTKKVGEVACHASVLNALRKCNKNHYYVMHRDITYIMYDDMIQYDNMYTCTCAFTVLLYILTFRNMLNMT